MATSTDRFDPAVNRGTLPKDWARCSGCGSLRPEHALKIEEAEVRCADESWCKAQVGRRHIAVDPALPGADWTVEVQVCIACGQVLPHAAACGATIDPELLGGT